MWTIIPIEIGALEITAVMALNRSGVYHDPGQRLTVPCYSWLLEEAQTGRKVLVDGGLPVEPDSDKWGGARFHCTAQQKENQNALKNMVLDFVVQTHLHWDSAGGLTHLAGKPEIYVQRAEIQYAVAPYSIEREFYGFGEVGQMPFFAELYHQYRLLDGDQELTDGLSVMHLPGHTPGFQAVLVETAQGAVLLAGDLIYTKENLTLQLPPGIRTDTAAAVGSIKKISRMQAAIWPGHERYVK